MKSVFIKQVNYKKQLFRSAPWKNCSENFDKISGKTEVAEFLLVNFEYSTCNSTKRTSHHGCFPGKTAIFIDKFLLQWRRNTHTECYSMIYIYLDIFIIKMSSLRLQCNMLRCKGKKKSPSGPTWFQNNFCCLQHKEMMLQHCS